MKKNSWKKGLAVCAVLTVSLLASSSDTFSDSEDITTFDVEGATYGTFPSSINEDGEIVGTYVVTQFLNHGFVRSKHGAIRTVDAPSLYLDYSLCRFIGNAIQGLAALDCWVLRRSSIHIIRANSDFCRGF